MNDASIIYVAVSALVLVFVVLVFITERKKKKHYSKLSMFGMILVGLGIVFGSDRLIGYSFIGAGLFFAMLDVILSRKNKNEEGKI